MNAIEKLKEIILENNWFDTLAGERFRDLYEIKNIQAVISFEGRSIEHRCFNLGSDSDSDNIFVTHLYIDKYGDVKVQLCNEDTDDISVLLHPSNEPIENYEEYVDLWVDLLTI